MTDELNAMEANNTWSVAQLPTNQHVISCMWMYKVKYKSVGTLKYKARLVANGHTQQVGVDFMDKFSPIAKLKTVRVSLSIVAVKGWSML